MMQAYLRVVWGAIQFKEFHQKLCHQNEDLEKTEG